jgi:hypothetical protein
VAERKRIAEINRAQANPLRDIDRNQMRCEDLDDDARQTP